MRHEQTAEVMCWFNLINMEFHLSLNSSALLFHVSILCTSPCSPSDMFTLCLCQYIVWGLHCLWQYHHLYLTPLIPITVMDWVWTPILLLLSKPCIGHPLEFHWKCPQLLGYGFLLYIFPLAYIHPVQNPYRNTLEICLGMILQIFRLLHITKE